MDVSSRVNLGVKWLDTHFSGWREVLNLTKLNVAAGEVCILGQVASKMRPTSFLSNDWEYDSRVSGYDTVYRHYLNHMSQESARSFLASMGFFVDAQLIDEYGNLRKSFAALETAWRNRLG